MPTRDELHKLVDSMPEGTLEAAFRALSTLQTRVPSPTSDMAAMRRQLEDRRAEMQRRMEEQLPRRPGTVSGFGGHGNYNPATGSGNHSFSYWDDNGFVVQTYRQHIGHEMMILERIRIDGPHLVYKHEITGPGEKHDEREVIFDIS
jgi:hypothetical protein